jgi:hypothetical protein
MEETTLPCNHCELRHQPEQLHPVIVAGVQAYNGHLLTNKTDERSVLLCSVCLENYRSTSIVGMSVRDDHEAILARGPIPHVRQMEEDERVEYAKIICDGIGECSGYRTITHEYIDGFGRRWQYCAVHAQRAYGFDLRRWRERQLTDGR